MEGPQINKRGTLEDLKKKVEEIHNLNEKYNSEKQTEEKALLLSQLQKAKKELEILEEKSGKIEPKLSNLEKFKNLKEKIRDLNERYLREPQREQKAILYSQLEAAQKEYRKLEEELDSQESKKGNEKGKEIAPPVVEPELVPSVVEPELVPNDTHKEEKKKFKAVIVDTTDVMKAQARDAGDAQMTMEVPKNGEELKGLKKFFKGEFWKRAGQKIWKHGLWRDYYRNKEIAKAREKILQTGNVFAGEGKDQAAHDKFVKDVMEQFASEYEEVVHTDAGEKRLINEEITNEQEVKSAVKKLIIEYATGRINNEAFKEEEARIFSGLKADTDGKQLRKREDVMHASNLEAIAEQVKEAMRVGEFLEDEDFDIDLVYGKSKAGVRTEAKFSRAEALAERLSHTKIGALVNETTIAAALSVASSIGLKATQSGASFAAKILPFIGTAAVSSGFAKLREGKKVEEERRQHAREMARGEKFDPNKMERRKEMEESRYQTQSAQELINNLIQSNSALIEHAADLTPEILTQTLTALADVEAKIRLSDRRNIDLISYSDTTNVVEERKNLDIEKAKMKVALRKLFESGKFSAPGALDIDTLRARDFESYFDFLTTTQENMLIAEEGGINAKDRIFNKMKSKRSWKAARTAFASGLIIGTTMQEIMALGTDQVGIVEDIFHHNVNVIYGGSAITEAGSHHLTGLTQLRHIFQDGTPAISGTGVLHEAFTGSHIKLPDGASMIHNADGSYNLISGGRTIAEHLTTNPDGTFTPDAQNILHNSGVNIDNHLVGGTVQQHITPNEYINNHSGQTHEMHRSWYDNNTKAFEENELRTNWGGEHGTGINAEGNYVLDVSHMTPGGSFHDGLSANAQELMKEGKLKMLISLSSETQNQVFEVPISPNGQIIVDAHSEIGKIAFANTGGHAQFLGRFGEIGQDMGDNHFRMLSTLEGPGVTDITDTITTSTPETILGIPSVVDTYNLPPFIPLFPRTPLEKLGMIEVAPYYMNYNAAISPKEELAQFEKNRSKTLKENPKAKLDHYKEIDAYLSKLDSKYRDRIQKLADQTVKMEKECKLSICIPVAGHQEGGQIYESLQNYTYQLAKKENFEITLFVNHPEKDQNGKTLNATETLNEIERFKKDYPEIRLRVMYEALPNEEAKIGKIRKLLADATLLRQHDRGENAPDLIMLSNDADNKGVDTRYVQTFLDKFENNPQADAMLGQLDWDPESYQKYPAIHIGTRLFQYLSVIGRRRSGGMVSSGANSAYRSSIYAGIGGYMDDLQGGEDVAVGRAIIAARGGDKSSLTFAGVGTRLFTSSRRAIDALNSGLSPVEQWNKGFSAFDDEIRKLTMKEGGEINYEDKETIKKLKESFEYVINRTLNEWERGEKLGKNAPYYKKALGWIGIKYTLDNKGDVVITDMASLIEGLKKYKIEGKLMRDARSGKSEAKDKLKSTREARKNKPKKEENKEIKRTNSEELERVIENFIDELPDHTQKIDALTKLLGRSLDNKFLKNLGLDITIEEIKKQLEDCKKIESGAEFIKKVKNIFKSISVAMNEHPEEFAKLKRKIFVEHHNFTPINEIFSYKIDGGDLHLHLAPASDFSTKEKLKLIKDTLEQLIKIVSSNKDVQEISATSPLVTSNPGLLKRVGFKIEGPISKEKQEQDFGSEAGTASRATISRKEFLAKYGKNKTGFVNLMKSWLGKLRRNKK